MRKIAVLALTFLPVLSAAALADEPTSKVQHLESWNDLAFDVGSGRVQQRFFSRLVLNEVDKENRGEFQYGLGYKPDRHLRVYLTGGYAVSSEGPGTLHAAVVSTMAEAAYGRHDALRFRYEGEHRVLGGDYRYDGYYAVDWWVVGLHVRNRGAGTEAGFQIGSGPGLLPFRFDVRISFGVSGGMPERSSAFVMSFDVP
jgi:hypothetical protein